jgi:oligoendopeptidase F
MILSRVKWLLFIIIGLIVLTQSCLVEDSNYKELEAKFKALESKNHADTDTISSLALQLIKSEIALEFEKQSNLWKDSLNEIINKNNETIIENLETILENLKKLGEIKD